MEVDEAKLDGGRAGKGGQGQHDKEDAKSERVEDKRKEIVKRRNKTKREIQKEKGIKNV